MVIDTKKTGYLPCVECKASMTGIVSYENITGRNVCWECEQAKELNEVFDEAQSA